MLSGAVGLGSDSIEVWPNRRGGNEWPDSRKKESPVYIGVGTLILIIILILILT